MAGSGPFFQQRDERTGEQEAGLEVSASTLSHVSERSSAKGAGQLAPALLHRMRGALSASATGDQGNLAAEAEELGQDVVCHAGNLPALDPRSAQRALSRGWAMAGPPSSWMRAGSPTTTRRLRARDNPT